MADDSNHDSRILLQDSNGLEVDHFYCKCIFIIFKKFVCSETSVLPVPAGTLTLSLGPV